MAYEALQNSDTFTLEYSCKDLIFSTATWDDKEAPQLSKFDNELRGRWDDGMEKGVFRYTMDHVQTRILPGTKKYVAQLNDKRATERRQPQTIMSVNQPFDPKQFNFTKIGSKEILFALRNTSDMSSQTLPNGIIHNGLHDEENISGKENVCQKEERHVIIVNISPLEYGHVLIVPEIDSCRPQIFTETSIKVGLECILLSRHRGFKLGFNSLCAYASVNHLHFHAYYLEHELMVEYCDVKPLAKNLYEMDAMPAAGFAFQLHGSSVKELSRLIFKITSYFQESEIAHSMFVTRGPVFGEGQSSLNRTVRIYLWARQKFAGTKSSDEFNVASIELGGHLPVKDAQAYHDLTEELADSIIAEASLPAEEYEKIKQRVIQIAQEESSTKQ